MNLTSQINQKSDEAIQKLKEEKLANIEPILIESRMAMELINKSHLSEMKSFKVPPRYVQLLSEAMCIVLGIAKPSWSEFQKVLSDGNFISKLLNFDLTSGLSDDKIKKLKVYFDNPDFTKSNMENQSQTGSYMYMWLYGVYKTSIEKNEVIKLNL